MTGVALCGRRHVCGAFDLRIDRDVSPAVTRRTITRGDGTRRTRMAHDGGLERRIVFMASVTLSSGRNVGCCLKYSRCAAGNVTTGTRTRRRGRMRKCRSGPHGRRVVAGVALCRSRYMCGRFRLRIDRGIGSVVAGRAIARGNRPDSARMAHNRRFERRIVLVTRIALGRRRNVCRVLKYFGCAAGDVAR